MILGLRAQPLHKQRSLYSETASRSTVQGVRSVRGRAMPASSSTKAVTDPTNSFRSQSRLEGSSDGPLSGLTLAVKDLFDVAGHKTGFGNPTWLKTHPPAEYTAPPIAQLLAAGATVVGKTHMDELAFSATGENAHYGTPVNVSAPGRIPGGSSSGSAAAVAAGQADIGFGSDSGGSVRVPASYCGVYGFRPTHGRISLEHVIPLAPSCDTVGWFTRDASLLQKVGCILLSKHPKSPSQFKPRWLIAKDAFALGLPETTQAIYDALSGDGFAAVTAVLGQPTEVVAAAELEDQGLGKLESWTQVFRTTLAYQVWHNHGSWVSQHESSITPGILDRFKSASSITKEQYTAADGKRHLIKKHMQQLLGSDGLLALPTAPGPAVLLNTPADRLAEWGKATLSLTCIAGLAGLPQVTLPIAKVDGLPVGLSLIGPAGSDEQLLDIAVQLTAAVAKPEGESD